MSSRQLRSEALEIMASFEMLSGLSPAEVGTLASIMTEVTIPQDTYFIQEDSAGEDVFLIVRGQAEIQVPHENGKGRAVLAAVGPGEPVGEFALARPGKRSATARATTTIQALKTTSAELKALCDTNPNIGYHIYRNLLRVTVERLEDTNFLARRAV